MALVSGRCITCYGSGTMRRRNMIGTVSLDPCKRCKGSGRVLLKEGSGEHRISNKLAFTGDSPGIRKHDNDRGMYRR